MPYSTEKIPKKFIGAVEDEWPVYSDRASDYTVGAPIGFGASSTVYAAIYHRPHPPQEIPCAVKVLDLDRLPRSSLSLLQRETQLMSLSKHPNVLRVRGSWMDGHKLCIAMRLMNKGSAMDVMRYGWAGGMEEEVIRCILKQALEGMNYLHINGFIHRDIKAANLLIDEDGTVLLGDLGVAASLDEDTKDTPSPQTKRTVNFNSGTIIPRTNGTTGLPGQEKKYVGKRRSFVGTPCWMAPEVINGKRYDSSADIWSFGITAIELAQGRAPRSRETPHKVLLQTVQDAPPKLDRSGGQYTYSRAFQEVVQTCLVKDPTQRPTAAQLLQTPFFKGAKKPGYLVGTILKDLPPLTQRQERCHQPSILTHRSIDSWDFPPTILNVAGPTSPTSSLFNKRPLSSQSRSIIPSDGVFELEDDGDDHDQSGDEARHTFSRHSRGHSSRSATASWISDHGPITEITEDLSPIPSPAQALVASVNADPDFLLLPPATQSDPQALTVPQSSTPLSSSPASSSFHSGEGSGSVSTSLGPTTPSSGSPAPSPANSTKGGNGGQGGLWRKLTRGGDEDSTQRESGVGNGTSERSRSREREKEKERKRGFVASLLRRTSENPVSGGGGGGVKSVLVRTTSRTYNAVTSGFKL